MWMLCCSCSCLRHTPKYCDISTKQDTEPHRLQVGPPSNAFMRHFDATIDLTPYLLHLWIIRSVLSDPVINDSLRCNVFVDYLDCHRQNILLFFHESKFGLHHTTRPCHIGRQRRSCQFLATGGIFAGSPSYGQSTMAESTAHVYPPVGKIPAHIYR